MLQLQGGVLTENGSTSYAGSQGISSLLAPPQGWPPRGWPHNQVGISHRADPLLPSGDRSWGLRGSVPSDPGGKRPIPAAAPRSLGRAPGGTMPTQGPERPLHLHAAGAINNRPRSGHGATCFCPGIIPGVSGGTGGERSLTLPPSQTSASPWGGSSLLPLPTCSGGQWCRHTGFIAAAEGQTGGVGGDVEGPPVLPMANVRAQAASRHVGAGRPWRCKNV